MQSSVLSILILLTHLIFSTPWGEYTYYANVLQRRKLRHRQVRLLSQGALTTSSLPGGGRGSPPYTVRDGQTQDISHWTDETHSDSLTTCSHGPWRETPPATKGHLGTVVKGRVRLPHDKRGEQHLTPEGRCQWPI